MTVRRRLAGFAVVMLALLGLGVIWALNAYGPQLVAHARNITVYDGTEIRFTLVEGAELDFATSIQVGSDGRIYAAGQSGVVHALSMQRNSSGTIYVAEEERIDSIAEMPNRGDDGSLDPTVSGRLITGLYAFGTADNPRLFVSSSDPRIDGHDVDTNSGVVSLLQRGPAGWSNRELVCGLPRSRADHATNGLYLDQESNQLYIIQGGNTNSGAPSERYGNLAEYALSAALLKVDLNRLPDDCYQLPTLDDASRSDDNDPYGGAGGLHQATEDSSGVVSIYATGFRNAYRLLPHGDGFLLVDNGANQFLGGPPRWDGDQVTNLPSAEQGEWHEGPLLKVERGGYYGHPNPTRADRRNTFGGQSPVTKARPEEAHFLLPADRPGVRALFTASVNGLAWYPNDAGPPSWRGKLVVVGFDRVIRLLGLDSNAFIKGEQVLATQTASTPLDVAVSPVGHSFAGTIWIADYTSGRIIAVEPIDGINGVSDALAVLRREALLLLRSVVFAVHDVGPTGRTMIPLRDSSN